jgi:hypothetical protein
MMSRLKVLLQWLRIPLILLTGASLFWWLPVWLALAGALVLAFILFLELFLAGVRGQVLAHRASAKDDDPVLVAPDASAPHLIWSGLVAPQVLAENAALTSPGPAPDGAVDAGAFGDPGDMGDISDGLDF